MNEQKRLFALSLICGWLGLAGTAGAATFVVDRTDDVPLDDSVTACTSAPNDCTLRGAIQAANRLSGADVITLPAGTYKLVVTATHPLPNTANKFVIEDAVTINGAGARRTIVDGNALDGVMAIFGNDFPSPGNVVLNNFMLTNGNASTGGGGLLISEVSTTLNRMIVKDNRAGAAGIFPGNGGGIEVIVKNGEAININRSTITGNVSDSGGNGAGIALTEDTIGSGTLKLLNDTITDNHVADASSHFSAGNGGGVYAAGNDLTLALNNDTITDNGTGVSGAVPGDGGGLFLQTTNPSQFTVTNTLIARNTVDGGNGADCTGSFTSKGYNFVTNSGACPAIVDGTNHDKVGGDPKLDPAGLKFNRNATLSLGLLAGSPAVDAGNDATCLAVDARGVTRPQGAACDIGAYEKGTCGDGFLEPEEGCDDGNTVDGDGCSATCVDEVPGAQCGNGILEDGEECDDGNTVDGDGCGATCQAETTDDPAGGETSGDTTGGEATSGDDGSGDTADGTTTSGSNGGGGCSLIRR